MRVTTSKSGSDDSREESGGLLRSLFGPSKKEVWESLARQISGEYVDGGFFGRTKVVVDTAHWKITLDTYTVSNGKTSTTYTRLRAPYVNRDGFRFYVARSGLFTPVGEMLGFGDIRVGHPTFDEAFVLKGNDETKVRLLFSDPQIMQLLAAQPRVKFEVRDDEGWFASRFPNGVDELYFSAYGIIKDISRLRALFDLFAAVLHRLCAIGSAYEDDPGVRL
jgi:hypothetical protein